MPLQVLSPYSSSIPFTKYTFFNSRSAQGTKKLVGIGDGVGHLLCSSK